MTSLGLKILFYITKLDSDVREMENVRENLGFKFANLNRNY